MNDDELMDRVKSVMCDLFYLSTVCESGTTSESLIGISYDALEVLVATLEK